MKVNSLVGMGSTRIDAKETIAIDAIDNLAEILKLSMDIGNKDIKMSYNKILTKAEANIKIIYLTEDNRIKKIENKECTVIKDSVQGSSTSYPYIKHNCVIERC